MARAKSTRATRPRWAAVACRSLSGSIAAAVLFAPSLLVGPIGRLVERGIDVNIAGSVEIHELELAWNASQHAVLELRDPEGEKVGDLEIFHPDRLASRILGMGDVVSLVEKAQETIDEEDAQRMAEKLQRAEFNFEDFLSQMQAVKKMGPLGGLMKMMMPQIPSCQTVMTSSLLLLLMMVMRYHRHSHNHNHSLNHNHNRHQNLTHSHSHNHAAGLLRPEA